MLGKFSEEASQFEIDEPYARIEDCDRSSICVGWRNNPD